MFLFVIEARPCLGGQVIPFGRQAAIVFSTPTISLGQRSAKASCGRPCEFTSDGAVDELASITLGDDAIKQPERRSLRHHVPSF